MGRKSPKDVIDIVGHASDTGATFRRAHGEFATDDMEFDPGLTGSTLSQDERNGLLEELRGVNSQLHDCRQKRKSRQRQKDIIEELLRWVESAPANVLEPCRQSRFHEFAEAVEAGHLLEFSDAVSGFPDCGFIEDKHAPEAHVFLVKHNWAGALSGTEGMTKDFRLPYDSCAFEFQIAGRRLIGLTSGGCVDNEWSFSVVVETTHGWAAIPEGAPEHDYLKIFVYAQIQAICISLDAEITEHTVVRAPSKLNKKRAKHGKLPIPDHYVVDLTRRKRVTNPHVGEAGTHVRLHFRRGHWRHFETGYKTWIKWCLVGDPDLGFVSKEYAL